MGKRYLVILTMQKTVGPASHFGYVAREVTPEPGWTRGDLLKDAQAQMPPSVHPGGIVLFFSAEPMELERGDG